MSEATRMERCQKLFARPLMAFVLISIGFALGRLTTPASVAADADTGGAGGGDGSGVTERVPQGPSRAYVTYLHGNLRCVTCNTIERMLQDVVRGRFSEELSDGSLVWREVNYDEDPTLAKRYDVATSTPVISWEVDGREAGFDKLDQVWSLMRDPVAFEDAVAGSIETALGHLPAANEADDGAKEAP